MKMNNNQQIVQSIRKFGKLRSLVNDAQILKAANLYPSTIGNIEKKVKNTPRIDTLDKFATTLGISVSDLIYPEKSQIFTPAQNHTISMIEQLDDDQCNQIIGFILGQGWTKNQQKRAA